MKKIFSILAAAIIALSFASCDKTDPGMKFFRLKASITEDSLYVSINPVDTTAFYEPIFTTARDIENYGGLDSIIAEEIAYFQARVNAGSKLEDFDLAQGVMEASAPTDILYPNTLYTLAAFEVKLENGKVSCGHVASKNFTSKKIDVVETIDLGKLDTGLVADYREDMGFYVLQGVNLDEGGEPIAGVLLCIYEDGDKLSGTYDYYDLEGMWSEVLAGEDDNELADAKFTCNAKADGSGKASGWVVGMNGVKYKFSFEYDVMESAPAPARIGKKEFVKEENNDFRSNLYLLNRK